MHPHIDRTSYGSITIDGECYQSDVIIRANGTVKSRKKGLSKHASGDPHVISSDEARDLCAWGATRLVMGTGRYGTVVLSEGALDFLKDVHCTVEILSTPDAIETWNRAEEGAVGLFHVRN